MVHTHTKIIAGIGLILLVISITTFFGGIYLTERHKNTLEERSRERIEAIERQKTETDLIRIVQETAEERAELASRILTEEDVITFVELVENVGREQGVTLITKSIAEESESTSFGTLRITFEAEGSYDALAHVLTMIEMLPYQSSINAVHFSTNEEGDTSSWKATYEVVVTKFLES